MDNIPSRYRPLFLIDEHDITVDEKSRILVPAEYRREILEARDEKILICRIGRNRVPRLYPENYYRELIAKRRLSLTPGKNDEKFNDSFYSLASKLQWDGQGRIVLSEKIISRARLGKELTIVGSGDHLSIWNRNDWDKRAAETIDTVDDLTDDLSEDSAPKKDNDRKDNEEKNNDRDEPMPPV